MSKEILAYTVSYGHRPYLLDTLEKTRGTAGKWFDQAVFLGAASPEMVKGCRERLNDERGIGIQYLKVWHENRGQHHATKMALHIARNKGYKWLLRLDDDITPRTKKWLAKMIERLTTLKELKDDKFYRLIAAPRIVGLKNALQPSGKIDIGQKFPVDVMNLLGGACRLHPMDCLEGYEPPLYDPVGRGDPQSITRHIQERGAGILQVRFPDIRIVHNTADLERHDSAEMAHQRRMGKVWPYLGATYAES